VAEAYKLAISVTGDAESRLISLSMYPHATRIEWIKLLTYGAFFCWFSIKLKDKRPRKDFYSKWVGFGSIAAVTAILIHEKEQFEVGKELSYL